VNLLALVAAGDSTMTRVGGIIAAFLATTPVRAEETITFKELQGASIEATAVRDQTVHQKSGTIPVQIHTNVTITLGPSDSIHHTWHHSTRRPHGKRDHPPLSGDFTLGVRRQVSSAGQGTAQYTFSDSTLTFVRTFKNGAFISTVKFARAKDAVKCTFDESFARQDGKGEIELESPSGEPTKVLSWKQVASTCRVTR
jgi:hypothetical protein